MIKDLAISTIGSSHIFALGGSDGRVVIGDVFRLVQDADVCSSTTAVKSYSCPHQSIASISWCPNVSSLCCATTESGVYYLFDVRDSVQKSTLAVVPTKKNVTRFFTKVY